jgi:ribosomal protein L4
MSSFLKSVTNGKRTLFLLEGTYDEVVNGDKKDVISVHSEKHTNIKKSIRNLQKVNCTLARDVSGYDMICAQNVVVTESALHELTAWLVGQE